MKTETTIASNFEKRRSDMAKRPTTDNVVTRIKPVYCTDGMSLSVQASREHYSFPKNNEGPYTEFEVGFPSRKPPESWRKYCKGNFDTKPCDTVYGNVPLALVVEMIEAHGGIRAEEAPKLILPPAPAPIQRSPIQQRRYNLTLEDMGIPS